MSENNISLERLRRYFLKDAFAEFCGIEIIESGPGYAKTRLTLDERHLNGIRVAHGGVVFTLADMAFAAAVHTRGFSAVAINATISFVKPGRAGVIYAEAREVSRNRRLATYTVQVTDSAAEVIAVFQGTAYIKADPVHERPA